MASFLRIGGDELELRSGRIVWRPGTAGDAEGIAFALTAHGGSHLLHVTGWLPGSAPSDLSCSELLLDVPGPDAALDGRIFAMALVRFGRVGDKRAVISLDGEIEDIEADSDARTTVAADIVCAVERAHDPVFCSACGTTLAAVGAERHEFAGGRLRDDAAHGDDAAPAAPTRCAAGRPPSVPPAASPTSPRAWSTRPTSSCSPTPARARPGIRCPASTPSRRLVRFSLARAP